MAFVPTADLCDRHADVLGVLAPGLEHFGGVRAFAGLVTTLRVRRDNALVRETLSQPGHGRVLVVDGGALLDRALVGGRLGALAQQNGWAGIVVWGAVRDRAELAMCQVGVLALASCPLPSAKAGVGERDVPVDVGGGIIHPGQWLAADGDGVVVADMPLF
jgi:regulator of ribonuclease activity A